MLSSIDLAVPLIQPALPCIESAFTRRRHISPGCRGGPPPEKRSSSPARDDPWSVLCLTGGIVCEPVDVAVPKRHLHVVYSLLRHSDKPFMGATTARERAEDTVAMARIAFGEDFIANHTVLAGVLNCNSPLVWDATMLDALKVYAASNQAVIASPFVMAGASTPASSAAAVAQLNAEALAGVAFAQLVRPGAPMIYGQFLATVDMQSGAPMAGTPEISLMNFMVGQLARRYRLPWRSSGMTAGSKLMDAQAAYESNMTMQSVLLAGANYVFHAAGWLEGGLSASFAKREAELPEGVE